jgi:hypothetical protein
MIVPDKAPGRAARRAAAADRPSADERARAIAKLLNAVGGIGRRPDTEFDRTI